MHTRTNHSFGIPPRILKEHLLYLAVGGGMRGEIAGKPFRMVAGDWLWIDPGIVHTFESDPGTPPLDVLHARFAGEDAFGPLLLGATPRFVRQTTGLIPFFENLIAESAHQAWLHAQRQKALLASLLIEAGRLALLTRDRCLSSTQCRTLERALASTPEASPSDLAHALRLNPDYFRRLFTRTYGIPPRKWLLRRRLERACIALRESLLSISEIAELTGYPDLFQFSRRFKREFGISPLAWRKQTEQLGIPDPAPRS